MKNVLYLLLLIACTFCRNSVEHMVQHMEGNTQGTTYHITYLDSLNVDYQEAIDSILFHYDGALSNYKPGTTLRKFNQEDSLVTVVDTFGYFSEVLTQSILLHKITEGAFNPAVWPLIQAWGFGTKKVESVPKNLDSLLLLIDISKNSFSLEQTKAGLQLTYHKNKYQKFDFNAIAQGHAVDVIYTFLRNKGIKNMMVEIGGEMRVCGVNANGKHWLIGIDKPMENAEGRPLKAAIELTNRAIATSGNYRKFKMINGKKVTHTINPATGKPIVHHLLSATVVAPNAMIADGLATAFMVMGAEKAKSFVENHPELQVEIYLIESDSNNNLITYASPSLEPLLRNMD